MILDILGLIASAIVSVATRGQKRELLLNRLGDLYVYRDSTEKPSTSCGVAIFGDKKTIKKVIEES